MGSTPPPPNILFDCVVSPVSLLVCHLLQGPSEVLSAHVDSVTLAKRSGDNTVELQVFHVQVGDGDCAFTFFPTFVRSLYLCPDMD